MQLSESQACPICFEDLKSPIILPCKHVFCSTCIQRALQVKKNGDFNQYQKKKQHCPLCRRVCCNLIRDTYETYNINESEQLKKTGINFNSKVSIGFEKISPVPSFQDEFFTPLEGEAELFFFEPYCIQLVNYAIKNDLMFCVDSKITNKDGSQKYCDLYEITHVQPAKVQRTEVYYCRVKNKSRALKISENQIPIKNSQQVFYDKRFFFFFLKSQFLVNLKILEDDLNIKNEKILQLRQDLSQIVSILTEGQGNPRFLSLVSFKDEVWQQIQEFTQITSPSLTLISKLSLQILCYLKMPKNSFNLFYYSSNLENRVEVLKKHSKAIHKIMTD